MELIVRHDKNEITADWLKKGLGNDYTYVYKKIPDPSSPEFLNLSEKTKNVIKLDKPDLIISRQVEGRETPIVIIEITESKPVSQHIEQRMVRVITAAEQGVASIFVAPKLVVGSLKKGTGKYIKSSWKFSPKHYELMYKIGDINRVPTIFYHFPDKDGTLIKDNEFPNHPKISSDQMLRLFNYLSNLLQESNNINDRNYSLFNNKVVDGEFSKQLIQATQKYEINTKINTTHEIIQTVDLKEYLTKPNPNLENRKLFNKYPNDADKNKQWIDKTFANLPERITSRDKTLVVRPKLSKSRLFEKSGDPYVGMLGSFDYAFCRYGRNVEDRKMNLIFIPLNDDDSELNKVFAPKGYTSFYNRVCPFKKDTLDKVEDQFKVAHFLQYGCTYTKNRPLKIYGYFCDLIVFKDGVLVF